MNTLKLLAALLILILGVNFAFPEKSAEFSSKFVFAVESIFNKASTTIDKTGTNASTSLKDELNKLPETSEVQKNKITEAQKVTFASPLRAPDAQTPVVDVVLTEVGVVSWTNQARINANLPALKVNDSLNAGAKAKVQDMFTKQYFEHISPSGTGPAEIAKQSGYEYILVGENLALGNFKNDQELLAAWMASPGHRANILNTRYAEIGVAIQKGNFEGQDVWMAVQEFGLPLANCPSPDATLKDQITSNENLIKDLYTELQRRKEVIAGTPTDTASYNDLVAAYNERIIAYNKQIEATRVKIETYNAEVKTFNVCLQG